MRSLRQLLWGIATFVPGVRFLDRRGTGGTGSARYCYSVWLRHLVLAKDRGLLDQVPATVAELGPGDSIGIGLAALLSGATAYRGLDVVPFASREGNLAVFDGLVELFRSRAAIPGPDELPGVRPALSSYAFPAGLLPDRCLDAALATERLERIRRDILEPDIPGSCICYSAPWHDPRVIVPGTVDFLFSQAVLEHVDDLDTAYRAMAAWLRPGAGMSHQVDYRCHGYAPEWNGHWGYGDLRWRLIRGRRPYFLNRAVHSVQRTRLLGAGIELVAEDRQRTTPGISRRALAPRFRAVSDDDLATDGAFLQARRPAR